MARAHLDEQDLKRDPVREFLVMGIDYVYRRPRRFIAAAVVIAAVIVAGVGWQMMLSKAAQEMAAQFSSAEGIYLDESISLADRRIQSDKALRAFIAEHPDGSLTPFAWIHLAAVALEQDKPEQAEEAYRNAISASGTPEPLRVIAQMGLAKIHENRGEYDLSRIIYEALPKERYGDLAALSLGRIAVAKSEMELARKQLEIVEQEYPDSSLAPLARRALSYYP